MNDDIYEKLSSLMDNEVSKDQEAEVIKAIQDDESLGDVWRRFHIISDSLKLTISKDLSNSVVRKISE